MKLRNRHVLGKKGRYEVIVVVDEEDEEEEEDGVNQRNEEEKEEQLNQSGEHNEAQQSLPKSETLRVICGDEEGLLYREKFENGEACIKWDDEWLRPQQFEEKGGRGLSKKWKASIFCEDKPLQFWLEHGELQTKGFQRRGTKKARKKRGPSTDSSDSSSEERESDTEEDSGDGEWLPHNKSVVESEREEERRPQADHRRRDSGEEEDMKNGETSGREMKLSRAEISSLRKNSKVLLERLPSKDKEKAWSDSQTHSENSEGEDPTTPPPDDLSDSVAPCGPSLSSAGVSRGGNREASEEESAQSNERVEDGEREIGADIKPKILHQAEDPDAHLPASPVLPAAEEGGGPPTELQITGVKSLYTNEAATCPDISQAITVEQQTDVSQASPDTESPDMGEGPSSGSPTNCCLDTLDLNELKRMKSKMQIKVLRLQEEYYTLGIKKHKKDHKD